MKVIHEIEPVWDAGSKVLILGTMPSPASRKAGFFYMHTQNRFWQIMQNLFCEKFEFKNNGEIFFYGTILRSGMCFPNAA